MKAASKHYSFKRLFGECVGLGIILVGIFAGISKLSGEYFMQSFFFQVTVFLLITFVVIGYVRIARNLYR